MKTLSHKWWLTAAIPAVAALAVATVAVAASTAPPAQTSGGLGRTSGLLPTDHLTLENAIQVDLSKETARLPLYKGKANGTTVWYVLLDASDAGLAHDLGLLLLGVLVAGVFAQVSLFAGLPDHLGKLAFLLVQGFHILA